MEVADCLEYGFALKPARGLCPPGPPTKGGGLWNPFNWLR